MELRVNDYIRTKDGLIRKIVEIDKLIYIDKDYISDEPEYHNSLIEEDVIKSSPNIIDLIEVGDIVNYGLIGGGMVLHKENDKIITNTLLFGILKNKDIKSVITKEQLKNCMYEVGE